MKKILLLGSILVFTATAYPVLAQDAKSTPIVNTLTSKIQTSSGIKADFIMSYYDAKNVKKNTMSGKFKIKGESYAIDMSSHKIYCDGRDVINYLVNSKEVQLSKYNSNDLLSPYQLFNSQLQHNYKYKYLSSTLFSGKAVDVIEFTPAKENKSIKSMHLFVDSKTNTIIGGKLFDKKGGYYYYTLNNVQMNASLKASDFTFNYKALSGVEVVDLR